MDIDQTSETRLRGPGTVKLVDRDELNPDNLRAINALTKNSDKIVEASKGAMETTIGRFRKKLKQKSG